MLTEIDNSARLKELSALIIPLQAQISQMIKLIKIQQITNLKEDLVVLERRLRYLHDKYFELIDKPIWD